MKHILTTTFLVIFCVSIYAQTPNWQWVRSAHGQNDAVDALGVATDIHGDIYVTGWFFGPTINFGTTFMVNSDPSATDMYLVKYDSSGNVLWARSGGGTEMEWGNKITTDARGNVYVIGEFTSPSVTFDPITLSNSGWDDFFIVKYDQYGNILWAKSAGGAGSDKGHDIATDGRGNIYATGVFTSQKLIFGKDTLINSGSHDVFIVKYDPSGNVLWAKSAGRNGEDWGKRIATDASGNTYVIGDFTSTSITFGSTTLTNKGGSSRNDVFIAKYDSSGNALWAVSAGDTLNEYGMGICTDAKANVFITGLFDSPRFILGSDTLTNTGSADIYTAKYDSSGNVLWAKSGGGKGREWGEGISANANGNVYITGWFESQSITFDTITFTNSGGSDICVVKYDSSGNVLWGKNVQGSYDEWGQDISNDIYGNVYVTGETFSFSMNFDAIMLKASGDGDIFLGKINDHDRPSIVIISHPPDQSVCLGEGVTFSVGALGNNLNYQWKKNGANITDATTDSLYIGSVSYTDSGIYTCTISDTGYSVTSYGSILTIYTSPVVLVNPTNVYSNIGKTDSLTVISSGKNLNYQWQKNGIDITSATNQLYKIDSALVTDTGIYRCIVSNACGSDTSANARLAIVIKSHPQNKVACEGTKATLRIETYVQGLSYQWKKNGIIIPGATLDSFFINAVVLTDSGTYSCYLRGPDFNMTSNGAKLTINTLHSITSHPVNTTKCAGQSVSLSVTALGTGIAYQWRKGGTNIPGATKSSYTITTVSTADSGNYDVVVSGSCAVSITSNTASLTVNTKPVVTTHPANSTKKEGETVTFSVSANGGTLTYQWQKNGTNISGATSGSYTKTNLALSDSGLYRCIVTNNCGSDTSNVANLHVDKKTGIRDSKNENQISIHPNPSSGLLTIEIKASDFLVDMLIFDINGRELMQKRISEPTTTINISHLPQGLYYICLKGQKSVYFEKIVKQ